MNSPARQVHGITLVELIVVVVVIGVLLSLAVPSVTSTLCNSPVMSCLNCARQIQMATVAMANDGETNNDLGLGWPGDLKANGRIATLADYVNVLARNGYIKAGDLKIFSGPGCKPYQGKLTSGSNGVLDPAFTEENCALKVYLVKDSDSSNTVFLASKNYLYKISPTDPNAGFFEDKCLVFLRKGGDASVLKKPHFQKLQPIGPLPGGGAENCLNPGPAAPK